MNIFIDLIVPVLIAGGMAALFGMGLAYLGIRLQVEKDPRVEETLSLLSGANCGGCGYAGCAEFAVALTEGKADVNACNPTSKSNRKRISALLGSDAGESEDTVAVIHCSGGAACKDKYQYQGYGDCQSAEMLAGGSKACMSGCMGLGSCFKGCKYDAISLKEASGYAYVSQNKCTSCGA
ncbi:MAG: hypothetical protein FWE62_05575, partial [Firmicutes bacterium]|nr:hypothetical protein [Bacillota bacterium]